MAILSTCKFPVEVSEVNFEGILTQPCQGEKVAWGKYVRL